MNMVVGTADSVWRAMTGVEDRSQIAVKFRTNLHGEEWNPILGTEDQMQLDIGQRLWHGNVLPPPPRKLPFARPFGASPSRCHPHPQGVALGCHSTPLQG